MEKGDTMPYIHDWQMNKYFYYQSVISISISFSDVQSQNVVVVQTSESVNG